ncbi:Ig-like domain-containing protein [Demequina aestuarii]|uniref:Ig-like domain-containing protein n=1 Tax=Demequina aestuarii TaxID=327095 RepID=UPI0007862C84|nr:Ig-like domain-containing protein [Demequina aestuarii]
MSGVDAGLGRATAARWRTVRRASVAAALTALVVGIALSPGFDEREVQVDDPSVWALQTAAGERFGRVNTVVSEVDTVKAVEDPSDILQMDRTLLVFSDNLGSVTTLDAARPRDIGEASGDETVSTPLGTTAVAHTGDVVAYLTESGEVLAGSVSEGTAVAPRAIDPYADVEVAEGEDRPQFRAVAAAVSVDGTLAAYSAQRQSVLVADAIDGEVRDTIHLPEGPESDGVQLAWVGSTWVLLDPDSGLVWTSLADEPVATDAAPSALLQASSPESDTVIIADDFGAVTVPFDGSGSMRTHGSSELALGQPARPAPLPGTAIIAGAWLPVGEGPGTLWMSNGTTTQLDYGQGTLGERRTPQLRSNGARLILNEARSGWVWGVPSGALVPSSQEWVREDTAQQAPEDEEIAAQVSDPRAPVAEDDALGVRAGRQISLPVLLNDHDANGDVLTVVPNSLAGLDPAFGTLAVGDDDQTVVVDVAPGASGASTFTYAVTDGTAGEGLLSEPASVTLTVKDTDENDPPVWCGVDDCLATWPAPQVAPGGTVSVDVLSGWVDPEGDPMYVAGARTEASAGVVASSPEGDVVFQHTNASSTESGAVPVDVTVSDSYGAQAERTLTVAVMGEPELRADDVVATVTAGVTTTVDVAGLVSGARGPLVITEAASDTSDDATVAVAQGTVGFTFTAPEAGSSLVDYTLTDGVAEVRGLARVTVIAPEQERLSTVPLTAFVRSREDATIDVLSSVTNPGGHVLLLDELETEPAEGARLSADIVGHSALRISGETADAQPGLLGVLRYSVSDGSGRTEATARGEVTVMLLDSEVPSTPLAVDDAITVRAGTQADVDVLANDVGPAGNVIALDAASVEASEGAGLAFPARSTVRYLAPDEPGVHEISYATYVLGYPAQRDTATVVVTVLESDTNAPPTPIPLSGRVASGQTVRLPFDGTGTDPDGDAVALQRIEAQPESGSARVSSDGQSIVYTADAGFAGQVAFDYSVVDARGQGAIATATVGVLAADVDPRPVTYSDYVQAQVGPDRRVSLEPTGNDIDLAGGDLELLSVRPDADPASQEFAALSERLESVEDGRVTLSVGEETGTHSFVYTVRNPVGSTAIGRIVLKAVRDPVADVPVVDDTVLTAENRDTFASGVDVLTDRVSWSSGEADDLALSLWGDQPDLTLDGRAIAGPLPEVTRLVPFQVTGRDYAGEQVVSYGFLRVPGADEVRVALRDDFAPPEVDEGDSVTFDLIDLAAIPEGFELDIDAGGVAASGHRADSSCALVSGTTLRYAAGMGDPYTDTCLVPVTLAGQDEPTVLPVPIVIIAEDPQPILTGASLELSPGETTTFDVAQMVSWPQGAAARAVGFFTDYSGQHFDVSRAGTELTVTAKDASIPGRQDVVTVSLPSDPATPATSLSLEVGPAPSELPKGASVVQRCSQASGSSCTVTVAGVSGEVNPLPGTPLELVDVAGAASCPQVTWSRVDGRTVRATWAQDAPGAVCDATFTVRDAQGRVSAGDRQGAISLDLQGFPAAPAEIRQTAFADGRVTLAVTPGPASAAYPAISGFEVYAGNAQVATCSARGTCPELSGLTNGDKRQYTARAVNAVGQSRDGVSVTAWAYAPPASPTDVQWSPTRDTGGAGGLIDVTMRIPDPTTRAVTLSSPTGATREYAVSGRTLSISGYEVGSNQSQTVTVTPMTALQIPPVGGGDSNGEATSFTANGVGAPELLRADYSLNENRDRVTFTVQVRSGGEGSQTWVGIETWRGCSDRVQVSGGRAQLTADVDPNTRTDFTLCGESRYGGATFAPSNTINQRVYSYLEPGAPTFDSGYRVASTCTFQNDYWCTTVVDRQPDPRNPRGTFTQYSANGGDWSQNFSLPTGRESQVRARYCIDFGGGDIRCSEQTTIVPAQDGSPLYPIEAQISQCRAGVDPNIGGISVNADGSHYTASSTMLGESGGDAVAIEDMRRMRWEVSFTGALGGMNSFSRTVTCDYTAPPPDPSPEPTPEP